MKDLWEWLVLLYNITVPKYCKLAKLQFTAYSQEETGLEAPLLERESFKKTEKLRDCFFHPSLI